MNPNIKKIISILFLFLFCLSLPAHAAEKEFLKITKGIKKQGAKEKTYAPGEIIPGVRVNDKEVKIGHKIYPGDRVCIPKDIFVTFESSNGNILETKTRALFIVTNITDQGESYVQQEG